MGNLLASTTTVSGSSLGVSLLGSVAIYLIVALGAWGSYKKAGPYGAPAWAAFIPIYHWIVLLRIAGRPRTWAWFLLLGLAEFVRVTAFLGSVAFLIVTIIVIHDVSKSFGHGGWFTAGMVILPFIFWYILWLGASQYRGPAGPAGSGDLGFPPPYGGSYPAQAPPPYPSSGGYSPPAVPPLAPPPPPSFPNPGEIPPPPPSPPPGQLPPTE